ncbi:MAG: ATPase domain-containing protein [Thermoplasmata archaeon]
MIMDRPPICPSCQSPNKLDAARCRVCGQRLREVKKPRETSPAKPVVLERVMTGEVFTAVLGEVKSKEKAAGKNPKPVDGDMGMQVDGQESGPPEGVGKSNTVDDWMARASAAIELEKYDKAIGYLERALEMTPKDPLAWYKKGVCLAKLGSHDEAVNCYERAIEEYPEDAQLWHMKGKSLKEIKSYEDALFSVDRAIEIRPEFADAWYSKGSILQLFGKIVEAYVSFLETLKLNPNHVEARIRKDEAMGTLANKGLQSLVEGVTSWNDLPNSMRYDYQSGPGTSKMALLSLAEDAQFQERYGESLYFYDQALDANKDDSFLWQEKGNLLSKMGRYKQAMECYQKSATLASQARHIPAITERREPRQGVSHTRPSQSTPMTLEKERDEEVAESAPSKSHTSKPETSFRELDTEAHAKEQEIAEETFQPGEIGEDQPGSEDVSRLERRIDDIIYSDRKSPAQEGEKEEDFISSKLKVKPAKEKEIQRTYVKGFDEALGGGIPSGHVVLLTGAPGTMKSSLAFSILYNNVLAEERTGLYITLEQSMNSLVGQAVSLGMRYDDVRESLRIFDMAYLKSHTSRSKEQWMELVHSQVKKLKKKFDLSLLVIDSLDALLMLGNFEQKRHKTFKLFEWLRRLGVTTLVITERPDFVIGGDVIQSKSVEDFLADGILNLRLHLVNDVDVQRRIRCLKMREMNHNTGYMALSWDDGYFNVTSVVRR